MSRVHLLIDGYRRIACDGNGVPDGDDDTCAVSAVTCRDCLRSGLKMYEALTETIATRLVELGDTSLEPVEVDQSGKKWMEAFGGETYEVLPLTPPIKVEGRSRTEVVHRLVLGEVAGRAHPDHQLETLEVVIPEPEHVRAIPHDADPGRGALAELDKRRRRRRKRR